MQRSFTSQSGMSLVEATIILLVLMVLTSVLAPSMGDFITDAKMVRVKEDCEAIGIATNRLVRDVGACVKTKADGTCIDAIYSLGAPGKGSWPDYGGDMEEQFVTNEHAGVQIYPLPGWRGAYLAPSIGPDPWGTRYGVNTKFLAGDLGCDHSWPDGRNPCNGIMEKEADVICIAAGPNQVYDSNFDGNHAGGTTRRGDDFIYVIQSSQRSIAGFGY
jgi:type II secretory pathway pseudopilin PulG